VGKRFPKISGKVCRKKSYLYIEAHDVRIPGSSDVVPAGIPPAAKENQAIYAPKPDAGGDTRAPMLRLRISDNGAGLPTNFDLDHLTSLGLHLAPGLARQMGGRMEIIRGEVDSLGGRGPGVVFDVLFNEAPGDGNG